MGQEGTPGLRRRKTENETMKRLELEYFSTHGMCWPSRQPARPCQASLPASDIFEIPKFRMAELPAGCEPGPSEQHSSSRWVSADVFHRPQSSQNIQVCSHLEDTLPTVVIDAAHYVASLFLQFLTTDRTLYLLTPKRTIHCGV